MNLIVGVNEEWGIGYRNELLSWVPEDIAYFKEITMGKVVIMGYLTFLSLPNQKPLPGRVNIVVCNDSEREIPGVLISKTLTDLSLLTKFCSTDDLFVIGGASIYEQLLPYCATAYVTKFRPSAKQKADKFFPNLDEAENWELIESSEEKRHEDTTFTFNIYENTKVLELAELNS